MISLPYYHGRLWITLEVVFDLYPKSLIALLAMSKSLKYISFNNDDTDCLVRQRLPSAPTALCLNNKPAAGNTTGENRRIQLFIM